MTSLWTRAGGEGALTGHLSGFYVSVFYDGNNVTMLHVNSMLFIARRSNAKGAL